MRSVCRIDGLRNVMADRVRYLRPARFLQDPGRTTRGSDCCGNVTEENPTFEVNRGKCVSRPRKSPPPPSLYAPEAAKRAHSAKQEFKWKLSGDCASVTPVGIRVETSAAARHARYEYRTRAKTSRERSNIERKRR